MAGSPRIIAANHLIAGTLPPRDENMQSGRSARDAGRTKERKDDKKSRMLPLTKTAPYKPDAGNLPVRFDERDVETESRWNH
jgi:hypothetical protein